jgi:DNA-binding response OmpR family regulator
MPAGRTADEEPPMATLSDVRPRTAPRVARCGVTLDFNVFGASFGDRPLELTAREFDLLRVLVEQHDRVLSRREIHVRVWSNEGSKSRVVDTYVSRLRRKLTDAGHPGIRAVHMRGYRLLDPAEGTVPASVP